MTNASYEPLSRPQSPSISIIDNILQRIAKGKQTAYLWRAKPDYTELLIGGWPYKVVEFGLSLRHVQTGQTYLLSSNDRVDSQVCLLFDIHNGQVQFAYLDGKKELLSAEPVHLFAYFIAQIDDSKIPYAVTISSCSDGNPSVGGIIYGDDPGIIESPRAIFKMLCSLRTNTNESN